MSTTISEQKCYTPDDLLEMEDAARFELVDGQLVERNVSTESSAVAVWLSHLLGNVVYPGDLGTLAGADCSYLCFSDILTDKDRIRKPDVSFITAGRLDEEDYQAGHTPIAPDLAVEVVSPNDKISDLHEKIAEYLKAGVRLIWVVHPRVRTVDIYRIDGTVARLTENDELSGEDVIAGFMCRVGDLFKGVPSGKAN